MKAIKLIVMGCLFSIAPITSAVEPLQAAALLNLCSQFNQDPNALGAVRCGGYLQGYLGGANAMRNVDFDSSDKKKSEFVERAQRTRAGGIDQRYGMNIRAAYCVPQQLTINDLVANLNKYAEANQAQSGLAGDYLLTFFRQKYACKME